MKYYKKVTNCGPVPYPDRKGRYLTNEIVSGDEWEPMVALGFVEVVKHDPAFKQLPKPGKHLPQKTINKEKKISASIEKDIKKVKMAKPKKAAETKIVKAIKSVDELPVPPKRKLSVLEMAQEANRINELMTNSGTTSKSVTIIDAADSVVRRKPKLVQDARITDRRGTKEVGDQETGRLPGPERTASESTSNE